MIKHLAYRLVAVLVLVLAAKLGTAQITAPIQEGPDGKKYYFHTVEQGQTLWQIKGSYQVSIDAIKKANPDVQDWDRLSIGQLVMIPVTRENKRPDELPAIEGEYLKYTVKKGETMSSIARDYNISMNDILVVNADLPDLENLQVGQVINIPILRSNDVDETAVAPAEEFVDSLIIHHVVAGDNLYRIAKQYGVKEVDIIALNPELENQALKAGSSIRIPKLNPEWQAAELGVVEVMQPDTAMPDTFVRLQSYNVAVLLPFYLDKNDAIQASLDPHKPKDLYPRSVAAYDFYHGLKLAVDSLKDMGLSVNMYFFDTARDTAVVKTILNKPEMSRMHLIIGPMTSKNVMLVADFAKSKGIAMVSPVSKATRVLLDNPYVSKVTPSNTTQVNALAKYIADNHAMHNVLLVDSRKPKDKHNVQVFKKEYEKHVGGKSNVYHDSLRIYKSEENSIKALSAKFRSDTLNVIVLPSTDLAYVSHFFTMMAGLRERTFENHRFMIVGLEQWQGFDDISIPYKQRYDVHVTSSSDINWMDTVHTIPFIKSYRTAYQGNDPGKYSVMGFDVGYYYLSGLMYYGTAFMRTFGPVPGKPMYCDFKMKQTGPESGFENQNVYILEYKDFQLIRKQ